MIYVKIGENLYPAEVTGKVSDQKWDGRESKAVTIKGSFAAVDGLFQNDTAWSIVCEDTRPVTDEQGEIVIGEDGQPEYETMQTEYDNSDFCIRGDLTVHTDGTCTVEMGKPTDLEDAYEMLYGGAV